MKCIHFVIGCVRNTANAVGFAIGSLVFVNRLLSADVPSFTLMKMNFH